VGLLAEARDVQDKLNRLALTTDMDTAAGRMHVLQETSLELLRHPEYWTYGKTVNNTAKLSGAETTFNQLSLQERSKFTTETISKISNKLTQVEPNALLTGVGELSNLVEERPEYIVVTILAATTKSVKLPIINGEGDMRQVLQTLGSIDRDALLAIEVIWTPQSNSDTLSKDDILTHYPDLKLV
jgi:uncharacterized membrane protein